MKFILGILILFLLQGNYTSFSSASPAVSETNLEKGFALVELFTSEGCSSCPPAEDVIEDIQSGYTGKKVIVLAYHVDYWDRLGWKDIYSDPRYTARQQFYARVFKLRSIYTPQAVINGEFEMVGSDHSKLNQTIGKMLDGRDNLSIQLEAVADPSGSIRVDCSTTNPLSKYEALMILLVQKSAVSQVKNGENRGATLHHINIVRNLVYLPTGSNKGVSGFALPKGFKKEDYFITVLAQNMETGDVSGLKTIEIK